MGEAGEAFVTGEGSAAAYSAARPNQSAIAHNWPARDAADKGLHRDLTASGLLRVADRVRRGSFAWKP
jgi:hypothetical protein